MWPLDIQESFHGHDQDTIHLPRLLLLLDTQGTESESRGISANDLTDWIRVNGWETSGGRRNEMEMEVGL